MVGTIIGPPFARRRRRSTNRRWLWLGGGLLVLAFGAGLRFSDSPVAGFFFSQPVETESKSLGETYLQALERFSRGEDEGAVAAKEWIAKIKSEILSGRVMVSEEKSAVQPLVLLESGAHFSLLRVEDSHWPFLLLRSGALKKEEEAARRNDKRATSLTPGRAEGYKLEEVRPLLALVHAFVHYQQWQEGHYPWQLLLNPDQCPVSDVALLRYQLEVEAMEQTCTLERKLTGSQLTVSSCNAYAIQGRPALGRVARKFFAETWGADSRVFEVPRPCQQCSFEDETHG